MGVGMSLCVFYRIRPLQARTLGAGKAATPSQKCDFLFNITRRCQKKRKGEREEKVERATEMMGIIVSVGVRVCVWVSECLCVCLAF